MTMPTCDSEVFFTFSLALFMRPTCDKDRHPKEALLVQSELIKRTVLHFQCFPWWPGCFCSPTISLISYCPL